MLRSGDEYLTSIRDGRAIYIGDERVEDATEHPAFAEAARTYAAIYEMKRNEKNLDILSYEEGGARHSTYFLQPRSKDDLLKRTAAHRAIAEFSYGILGRSPDTASSMITGLAMKPEALDEKGGYPDHLTAYYRHLRDNDLYVCYAVIPPQGARDPAVYESLDRNPPTLRVTAEDKDGVTLNGMKMLATGAVFANEVLIGNILPLSPKQVKESITCGLPLNAPGLTLWSRKTFADSRRIEADEPITHRFDESDSMLLFKDVKVPWERVFVHDNPDLARGMYIRTPAHIMANHQCNVRFHTKLKMLVGLASLITRSTGARDIPAVREVLGRLAALEAGYAAMIDGQHQAYLDVDHGHVLFNRRYVYAAIHWALENHSEICDKIRELMGGGMFQMPASASVLRDPGLRALFEEYWSTPFETAGERMKLFKLAWDLIGSELASRHMSYEKFFIGPAFFVRSLSFNNAPWDDFQAISQELMASYDLPGGAG